MARISSAKGWAAATAAALCLAAQPLGAQETQFDPRRVPFREWVAQGEQQQIPWKVWLSEPRLTSHQRIGVLLRVELSAKTLNTRGEQHDFALLGAMADSDGRWLDGGTLRSKINERFPARGGIQFEMVALVQPGEYTVGIVLLDVRTGDRSVTRRTLRVPLLKNDPLPEAWRNLPRVEFLRSARGFDAVVRPESRSRLWLPAPTRRPVHIEVLAVLALPDALAGRQPQRANLPSVLAALRVLTQMDLPNGKMDVTAVDLLRRQRLFEQEDARRMDWRGLRDALEQTNPSMISATALATQRESAAFLRELLVERLAAPEAATGASGATSLQATGAAEERPLRILIVLTRGILFPRGSDLAPLTPPRDCDCKVYYLEDRFFAPNLWDQVPRLLRNLHARRFPINRPMDLRRALAALLADLRKY